MRSVAPLVVALAALSLGCSRKATRAECTEMLDSYLDMQIARGPEIASVPPAQAQGVMEVRKAEKKATPAYAAKQAQCENEVSRREYDCAMATHDPNIWEACVQ